MILFYKLTLTKFTEDELKEDFAKIPSWATHLDLSNNHLGERSSEELKEPLPRFQAK